MHATVKQIHFINSAPTAGAAVLLPIRLDRGRILIDQWHVRLREGLLEAVLAIDLPVRALVVVLQRRVEALVALAAVEALLVPVHRPGGLPLGLKDLEWR